ncbi:MAG: ABC transporter ATP-binding protein [Erysipelotrichales bacterium]|nr:ABC transporter ATP-binding protein [Erysipelotrichales bacterium]
MKEKKKSFILTYVWRYKWNYILGIITLYAVDYLNLFIPQFTGEITDGLRSHSLDINGVVELIFSIILVGAGLAIGRFFWRIFIFGAARKIEYELRNDMFAKLETLSLRYFNENKTGDLMTRFTNDLQAIRNLLGPAIISAFDAIVLTILVIYKMMTYVDVKLTLIACVPMIIIAVGGYYFGEEIERRFGRKQKAFADLSDMVQESISGARVIKAFAQESEELDAFGKVNDKNRKENLNVVKLYAVVMPLLDVIVGVSYVIAIIYGGKLAVTGEITLGRFIAFNTYLGSLVWPMIAMGDSITSFSQGQAAIKRIKQVFDEEPDIFDGEDILDIKELKGEIELSHLTFSYSPDLPKALDDVSVKVKQGSTLAILGRTGAGKTTLVNLLERLYDVEDGMIKIDGYSIRQIPLRTLRENIAYVPQDNFLFSDTLQKNIAFGLVTATLDDVIKACEAACVHDNIIDFPEGYETMVGERGVTLSGGQKQRSSIARALLKNSPILILDDSLSAVDTDTEERILENLKELRKDKTTIIIAHRISTVVNADHVLVLENGKLAEYGTPDELMALDGIYRNMYEKQQLEKQLESEV